MPLINNNADVSSKATDQNFGLSLQVHNLYFLYVSSKDSHALGHMNRPYWEERLRLTVQIAINEKHWLFGTIVSTVSTQARALIIKNDSRK